MKKLYSFLLTAVVMTGLAGCIKENRDWAHGTLNPATTAETLRSMYKGSDVTISRDKIMDAYEIAGVVVSDASTKNVPAGTFILQNFGRGNIRGLAVNTGGTVPYALGDSVKVQIDGARLTKVAGVLQLTGITTDKVTKISSNAPYAIRTVSLTDLMNNFGNYEGTVVRINADITPLPATGETYAGDKQLSDGSASAVYLHTEAGATFAASGIPANAGFAGIALYSNAANNAPDSTSTRKVWPRNAADALNPSGPLYPNFPETFEGATAKGSYARGNSTMKSGVWILDQTIIASDANDRAKSPTFAIRMQQNLNVPAYLQMNFDLPNGASKVTLWHGSYGASTDPPATWRLEYSTDGGITWRQQGSDVTSVDKNKQLITFLMNISGPVRFRINKLGPGTSNGTTINNGRLSLDDFAVYKGF